MKTVTVSLDGPPPSTRALLLFPRPFGHWGQVFVGLETNSPVPPTEIKAGNSEQRAYVVAGCAAPATLTYRFEERDVGEPPSIWTVPQNRFTEADGSLVELAGDLTAQSLSQRGKLARLMEYAAGVFGYDHPDEHFYDDCDTVPAVCGTTRGDCVDINTFLLAAALGLGICGQYIAGYGFHPDKVETLDMHCWLAFEADGELTFWDLAHHLKWGVDPLAPGLNPAGGRRVAMSCGCGLRFETANGAVEIGHFSQPLWVLPGGGKVEPAIRVRIAE